MTKANSKLPPQLVEALTTQLETGSEVQARSGDVRLTLKELVKAADVSERTIRYYIQEGVLPPPQGAGPASRYGLEHLTRLSLVRRFKAALLPLNQIKQLLSELSTEELERVADQLQHELAHAHPVVEDKLRAARIRTGLKQEETYPSRSGPNTSDLEVFRPPEDAIPEASGQVETGQELASQASPAAIDILSFGGRWNRLSLAPGLELHYQEGGPQDTGEGRERLARLVELAMRLYR